MKFKSLILSLGLVGTLGIGCSSDEGDGAPDRSELESALGSGKADNDVIDGLCRRSGAEAGCDLCDVMGLYNDDTCDDFCPTPDADCGDPGLTVNACSADDLNEAGFGTSNYTLNEAKIDGTELVASLSFGGGCEEHEFAACLDGNQLIIGHNGNNDFCEAFLTQEVRFDLESLLGDDGATLTLLNFEGELQYKGGGTGGGTGGGAGTIDASQVQLCDPAMVGQLTQNGFFEDNGAVSGASIQGDELLLDLRFGGGCGEHDFVVCWSGLVLESFPPQAPLTVYHNPNGDFCEAFLSEQISVGLDVFGTDGEIYLNVGEERVLYEP